MYTFIKVILVQLLPSGKARNCSAISRYESAPIVSIGSFPQEYVFVDDCNLPKRRLAPAAVAEMIAVYSPTYVELGSTKTF